jgi:hypothetical protein
MLGIHISIDDGIYESIILKSHESVIKLLQSLTGLQMDMYDCCIRSCLAFTGPYSSYSSCPCGEARFISSKPRKRFYYHPLIPRLLLYYSNAERSKILQTYPLTVTEQNFPGYQDSWDGALFKEHMIGKGSRHLVFALYTDGFQVVCQKTHDIWPLLLTTPNLPPKIKHDPSRYHPWS